MSQPRDATSNERKARKDRTMPKVLKKTVTERKRQINNLHKIYSFRQMSDEIFGGKVSFQVLGRFAKEKDYVPVDEEVLKALDLITPPNPYRVLPRYFQRTKEALAFYRHQGDLIRKAGADAKAQFRRQA